jgi:predicted RNase H-like HicB family nuclease
VVERGQIDGYAVIYEQTPHNWSAYSPDLPGCISTGKTRAIVERNMKEAIAGHLKTMALYRHGRPLHAAEKTAVMGGDDRKKDA